MCHVGTCHIFLLRTISLATFRGANPVRGSRGTPLDSIPARVSEMFHHVEATSYPSSVRVSYHLRVTVSGTTNGREQRGGGSPARPSPQISWPCTLSSRLGEVRTDYSS